MFRNIATRLKLAYKALFKGYMVIDPKQLEQKESEAFEALERENRKNQGGAVLGYMSEEEMLKYTREETLGWKMLTK